MTTATPSAPRPRSPGPTRRRLARWLTAPVVAVASLAVLAVAAAPQAYAAPVPPTPSFGRAIEPLAAYDGATRCLAEVTQPGVAKLEALLKATYHKTEFDTWRACSGSKATSEHNEGRALDFMLNSANASDVAIANAFVSWLFATDKYGNTYANARRLGIMYLIWHGRMWRAYEVSRGWQPYTGGESHNDHIHISLSWAGARAQTSFWTGSKAAVALPAPSTAPLVYTTSGRRMYLGHQWSTTCVPFGGDGGRRCTALELQTVVVAVGSHWTRAARWVMVSVNYVDYQSNPYWATSVFSNPGIHVADGSTWRTSCPRMTATTRSCHTEIWAERLVTLGSTYTIGWAWRTHAQVFLIAH